MTMKLLPCMVIYHKFRVFPSHLCIFFRLVYLYLDLVRMRRSIELPNLCDKSRIPGMLSDVLAIPKSCYVWYRGILCISQWSDTGLSWPSYLCLSCLQNFPSLTLYQTIPTFNDLGEEVF